MTSGNDTQNGECRHDHGEGWVRREVNHMKDHWFSCLLGCVVVHLGMDLVEWVFELVKETL